MQQSQVSPEAFDHFFFWAPWIIGILIYAIFYIAKRHETAPAGVPIGQTYACANCGRRGHRDHMTPQEHDGAVSYYCSRCAGH